MGAQKEVDWPRMEIFHRGWKASLYFKTQTVYPHTIQIMELFILIGGAYALYTVGMAIATELDYRAFNRSELKQLRKQNDEILAGLKDN